MEVYEQQCFQLTITNTPCGLTTFFSIPRSARNGALIKGQSSILDHSLYESYNTQKVFCSRCFLPLSLFSGVYSGFATHVPIPNTIVKRARDDGTALRVWESSSTPEFFCTDKSFFNRGEMAETFPSFRSLRTFPFFLQYQRKRRTVRVDAEDAHPEKPAHFRFVIHHPHTGFQSFRDDGIDPFAG